MWFSKNVRTKLDRKFESKKSFKKYRYKVDDNIKTGL
jgi:hypothetical protein